MAIRKPTSTRPLTGEPSVDPGEDPESGCRFRGRCRYTFERCSNEPGPSGSSGAPLGSLLACGRHGRLGRGPRCRCKRGYYGAGSYGGDMSVHRGHPRFAACAGTLEQPNPALFGRRLLRHTILDIDPVGTEDVYDSFLHPVVEPMRRIAHIQASVVRLLPLAGSGWYHRSFGEPRRPRALGETRDRRAVRPRRCRAPPRLVPGDPSVRGSLTSSRSAR